MSTEIDVENFAKKLEEYKGRRDAKTYTGFSSIFSIMIGIVIIALGIKDLNFWLLAIGTGWTSISFSLFYGWLKNKTKFYLPFLWISWPLVCGLIFYTLFLTVQSIVHCKDNNSYCNMKLGAENDFLLSVILLAVVVLVQRNYLEVHEETKLEASSDKAEDVARV